MAARLRAMRGFRPAEAAPGLRHNHNFHRLWFGQAVSLFGDQIFDTTVVLWVGIVIAGGRPWGPLAVGGTLFASSLPIILLGLVGGVYADRWDRRRTMLAMDAIRAVLLAGLTVFAITGTALHPGVQLAVVYAVVALASTAAQFFNPARFGLMGTAVADADRERASALAQGTASVAAIAGPPLAAPLMVAAGVQWALLVTAVSFVVSFVAVATVRVAPVTPGPIVSLRSDLTAGLRFFAGHRQLRMVLTTLIVVAAGAGSLGALNAFFVTGNLHAPAELFGVLGMAMGLGSVAGAALAATLARRLRATRVYAFGLILTGVGVVAYARMTSLWPALVAVFLIGVPLAAANSMIGPLVLRATPSHLVGRVIAVLQPAAQLAVLLSVLLVTWLASTVLRTLDVTVAGLHFGTIDTILLAGGAVMVAGGIWAALKVREPSKIAP
jgi:MFS-type transporter involved in bile tolerance (Atg22 family)